MNRYTHSHPGAECLLQYADGELPDRHASQVRSHLEACEFCRAEIADRQATFAEFRRYREALPIADPPVSWETVGMRLERQIAERQARPRFRGWTLAATLAALAAACLVGVVELRHPTAVSAAEILRKASLHEIASGHRPLRPRIHDSARRTPAELRTLFRQANYNFDDPLSASAFQAWRDSLAGRSDAVALEEGIYSIRTSTPSNILREATLELRANDWGVVSATFRFTDDLVEIAPLPDEPPTPPKQSAPERTETPAPTGPPASPAASSALELHVLAALHQAGADLGEQIEVSRDPAGRLAVTATGIAPGRQAALENSLAPFPGVALRVENPRLDLSRPTKSEASRAAPPESVDPLRAQLAAALGGAAELSNFTDQVLEISESATVEAHNLRDLAARFPLATESQLDPPDRALLANLRRDHVQALTQKAAELQRLLAPVLASLGASFAPLAENPGPPDWQSAGETLFAATQRFDRSLTALFTGGPADHSTQTVSETARELVLLRSDLDWFRHY